MTLEEAIKHCEEEAKRQDDVSRSAAKHGVLQKDIEFCKQCATDHRQLAEWLKELLQRREWCAQYEVEQISNLEQYDMLSREYEILNERYKEAVKLLKAAVEDFAFVSENFINHMDSFCSMYNHMCGCVEGCPMSSFDDYGGCKWRYTDEALKLIGDESSGI